MATGKHDNHHMNHMRRIARTYAFLAVIALFIAVLCGVYIGSAYTNAQGSLFGIKALFSGAL
jgi:nitric oxide reductase large subunit